MLNNITFNRNEGGLGRALAGEDHISGMVYFTEPENITGDFNSNTAIQIFSLSEAEALGITEGTELTDLNYELKMLFEANNKAVVFVSIFPLTGAGTLLDPFVADLSKILDVQRFAEGKIRQIGVHNGFIPFEVGHVVSLQDAADILEAEHKPLSIVYYADTRGFQISTLPDLRTQDAKNVSVSIGADSISATEISAYMTALGSTIGHLSIAKVNENIGWVGRFNVSNNSINEFDVPILLIDGVPKVKEIAPSALDTLNDKGYIFLIKHIGTAGTYFNDSHTAKVLTSDYAYIENNRTIDKAVRGVRSFLLPSLNAPLYVNNDGTLTEDTIASFRNDALRALEQMERDGEISAKNVVINPAQNVLSSSKITLKIEIIPVGVARNIEVNIGFVVKIK